MSLIYIFEGFEYRPDEMALFDNGVPVSLGSRAVALLSVLLENAGRYVSPAALMNAAWPETYVHEGNLRVQMAALRKRIQRNPNRTLIRNSPGRGYCFVGLLAPNVPGEDTAIHLKVDITVARGATVQAIIDEVTPALRKAITSLESRHALAHGGEVIRSASP